MPIKLAIAKTAEQIDAVFKLRHQVFCEEGKYFPETPDGRFFDSFDAYPTTKNIVAIHDEKVVGSLRLTVDSEVGIPADDYYDFRALLPEGCKLLSSGMYCVDREFRNPKIALGMIQMASYFALEIGISHVVGPINPPIAKLLKRVGFDIVGDEMIEPHTGLKILPAVLDVTNLKDFFATFAQKNQLQNFIGQYENYFYKKGEVIVSAGDVSKSLYVIIDGEAEIFYPNKDEAVSVLKEGDIFGELAMLTDQPRSASVIAKTELRAMTLDKEMFTDYMHKNPERLMMLMKNLGSRMNKLIGAI